jgi:hypothetical protein
MNTILKKLLLEIGSSLKVYSQITMPIEVITSKPLRIDVSIPHLEVTSIQHSGSVLRVHRDQEGRVINFRLKIFPQIDQQAQEDLLGLLEGPGFFAVATGLQSLEQTLPTCTIDSTHGLVFRAGKVPLLKVDSKGIRVNKKLTKGVNLNTSGEWVNRAMGYRCDIDSGWPYSFEKRKFKVIGQSRFGDRSYMFIEGVEFHSPDWEKLQGLSRYYIQRGLTEEYSLRNLANCYFRVEPSI